MRIAGYAALFGIADQMGDVVRAGAFAACLVRRDEPMPMLVEHERRLIAGAWEDLHEDGRGLFVSGAIQDDMPGAARAKRMIARGIDGLSIGFVPMATLRFGVGRVLEEIDLLEVSIVTHPMQPLARLTRDISERAGADQTTAGVFVRREQSRLTPARALVRAA
jgi:HK97 family phage prohead protease